MKITVNLLVSVGISQWVAGYGTVLSEKTKWMTYNSCSLYHEPVKTEWHYLSLSSTNF